MSKLRPLTLNSDTFQEFKNDFAQMLQQTIRTMQEKKSELGEMNVKFKIELPHSYVPTFGVGEDEKLREAVKPQFKHKINSVVQIKNEVSGSYVMVDME